VLWLRLRKAALQNGAKIVHAQRAQDALAAAGEASKIALIWDGVDLVMGEAFAKAFSGVAELCAYIASEQSNARGAEAMGMLPGSGPRYARADAGLDTAAMLGSHSGSLAVLSLFGVNPARNASDPAAARAALTKIPFLVVSEVFMTETAQLASIVLPACGSFERSGTTIGIGGDLLPINASLEAPPSVRSDLEMLTGLAAQLDVTVPSSEELHRAVVAHIANAAPTFTFGDARYATSEASPAAQRASKILSGGGTWQHDAWLSGLRA